MRIALRLISVVFAVALFAPPPPLFAQAAPDKPMPMAPAIIGTTWTAIEINGAPTPTRLSTFKINEEMKAVGIGGCNNWSAPILLEGSDIRIGSIRSTKKACLGPGMQQEVDYFAALAAAISFAATEGELHFLDAAGAIIIRFALA